MRYTPDGLAVSNFSVAVKQRVKNEDQTQWFRVTAFGKLGEICREYLAKGRQVYIEGQLQTSEWTDRENQKRFSLEIVAKEMLMLGASKSEQPTSSDQPTQPTSSDQPAQQEAKQVDDQIPF
jgi:single-strand DNA-binding protein